VRSKREVLEKFEQLRADRLKKRKEEFLSQVPRNCQHNARMRVKGEGTVGFCQNPIVLRSVKNKIFVCNHDETATRCRAYTCRNTHQSVEQDFDEILRTPVRCGHEYPKLAILIWFLQDYPTASRRSRLSYELVRLVGGFLNLLTFRWW